MNRSRKIDCGALYLGFMLMHLCYGVAGCCGSGRASEDLHEGTHYGLVSEVNAVRGLLYGHYLIHGHFPGPSFEDAMHALADDPTLGEEFSRSSTLIMRYKGIWEELFMYQISEDGRGMELAVRWERVVE